jgi:hypothetical protein
MLRRRPIPLYSSKERVRERFHGSGPLCSECRNKRAGVLALNLSRRDRNRVDLSSDK